MTELISLRQMETILRGILTLGIVVGIVAMAIAARRGRDPVLPGVALIVPPALLYVLWRVYNRITDALGLDRVVNLAANAVLFVLVGALCGWGWAKLVSVRERRGIAPAGDAGEAQP